ncbi:MAG: chitobiase/beta-hexosaminidase C-terminal domain-containing protein, partial [Planctomycetota bacterium]
MFENLKISLLLILLVAFLTNSARAECPPGDFDDSCKVDMEDLRIFSEQWLDGESIQADIDGVAGINFGDYAMLAEDWLQKGTHLLINEIMASNNSVYEDPDNSGEYSDWIEIYNAGDETIDMSGMYLTDNLEDPTQWRVPDGVSINSGAYLVVLADLLDYQGIALHTNFKLGAGGEQVGLYHPDGVTLVDGVDFDQVEQYTDISYGLDANDTLRFFGVPTPGAQNNDAYLGLVADTTFSRDRGFYDTTFDVELECETPGADIYYSVDFSGPNQVTGTEYTGPISVTQTTSIRAMAFKPGWKPTNVDTHTYIFADNVAAQTTSQAVARGFPNPWDYIQLWDWTFSIMDTVSADYEVESTLNGSVADFKEQLLAIPTMSIVTEMDDMWKWDQGYYVNSWIDGIAWEREASVEYFDAVGNEEFQINCALRAQGNQNRRPGPTRTPKHSMRLRFKSAYGPSKLRYPLFKDSDVETFDSITLRGGCADSWHQYGASRASYTRDGWTHRSMHEVGQLAPHGNYVHLYLNGLYWGLYNPIERPDASFYAEHVGIGEREEWEANNQGDPMGDDTPADLVVWNTIAGMCTGTFLSTTFNDTQYDDLSEWLDMPSFCDYLLVNFYGSTKDWGKWNFYAGALPGEPGQPPLIKLRFATWDAEEGLGLWGPPWDSTGPCLGHSCDDRGVIRIYSRLMGNAKFQALFADRTYKWLYNGAPLDNQNCIDRWLELAAQIGDGIIGESARWGDVDFETGTQSLWDYWIGEMAGSFFFGSRRDTVIGQLRSRGLYPSIDPPTYSQHGGYVSAGYSLTMTNPNGGGSKIYYTLDGSEPRDSGIQYSSSITLNESTLVKARVLKSGEWSALNEVAFGIGPIADNLRITEMMYHPADAPLGDPNAEFVEVKNVGGTALKLNL